MFAGFKQIGSETPCRPELTRAEGAREGETLRDRLKLIVSKSLTGCRRKLTDACSFSTTGDAHARLENLKVRNQEALHISDEKRRPIKE
jgi:hypothetical protein